MSNMMSSEEMQKHFKSSIQIEKEYELKIQELEKSCDSLTQSNAILQKKLSKSEAENNNRIMSLRFNYNMESSRNKELEKKLSLAIEAISHALEWEGDSYAWDRLNKVLKELI